MDEFYGDPRGKDGKPSLLWEATNLVKLPPPYRMTYAGQPIKTIRVHSLCAESLNRCLENIWYASGQNQSLIDEAGASIYAGAYNYRLMRGGNKLSTHSWGAAIDLDPARNAMGDETPNFLKYPWVVEAFEDEGWVWGGRWSGRYCDGMHFQAATLD